MSRFFACLLAYVFIFTAHAAQTNPFGGAATPAVVPNDVAVPRGYIVPSADPIPGGVKIKVDIYHAAVNTGVDLWLQIILNNGTTATVADLKQLSNATPDNPNSFRSHREFPLTFAELDAALHALNPALNQLQIGPGTPLFVYAKWANGHQWGGVARSGVVFVPDDGSHAGAVMNPPGAPVIRPTDLDLAFNIPQTMANVYNDPVTGAGLKVGGQVRSRVEGEGKFQIPLTEFARIRTELFRISKDPAEAAKVLGTDWTIELVDRYMQKDAAGNVILDAAGFPTPDPMVDTYYDSATLDAAKKDVAIRYRWTEGNKSGAWNFKPGIGVVTPEGLVYRVEYGLDTTDDKPQTIMAFADGSHPLNIFQAIRTVVPGSTPSQFLNPAVKLSDVRYKFKLKHKNGLLIEMSLDNVTATDLRNPSNVAKHFVQLEMDIDHLALQSNNVNNGGTLNALGGQVQPPQFYTPQTFIDGRIVMHDETDLNPTSPLLVQHKPDFDLASAEIKILRDHLLGPNWLPGAQKYAFAASELGLVTGVESASVVNLKQKSCSALLQGAAAPVLSN